MKQDPKMIHFWKRTIPDSRLQQWIDHSMFYSKQHFLILLDEKLRRAENEIYLK